MPKLALSKRFMLMLALALVLIVSPPVLTGCGVLGEVRDSYRNVEVCIGHAKYGWVCVMADGSIYFKKPPTDGAEREAAIAWARAEAAKARAAEAPK